MVQQKKFKRGNVGSWCCVDWIYFQMDNSLIGLIVSASSLGGTWTRRRTSMLLAQVSASCTMSWTRKYFKSRTWAVFLLSVCWYQSLAWEILLTLIRLPSHDIRLPSHNKGIRWSSVKCRLLTVFWQHSVEPDFQPMQ